MTDASISEALIALAQHEQLLLNLSTQVAELKLGLARAEGFKRERDEAQAEVERLKRDWQIESDRRARHPMAPERCPVCEWTNTHLMNYGEPGRSDWMCHGCAARRLGTVAAFRATSRALLDCEDRIAALGRPADDMIDSNVLDERDEALAELRELVGEHETRQLPQKDNA